MVYVHGRLESFRTTITEKQFIVALLHRGTTVRVSVTSQPFHPPWQSMRLIL